MIKIFALVREAQMQKLHLCLVKTEVRPLVPFSDPVSAQNVFLSSNFFLKFSNAVISSKYKFQSETDATQLGCYRTGL